MNARERTLAHLTRLRGLPLHAAAGLIASSCHYKVVDMLPDSYTYDDTGSTSETTAEARWTSTGTIALTVTASTPITSPVVTGGTVVSGSLDGMVWSGEIDPDDGVSEVVLDFTSGLDTATPSVVLHLDVSGTPVEGEELPGYFE